MRSAALNTPPSFFSINMGCGIASILLHHFPYPATWLQYLGTIVFVLNVVVFVLLLLATIARYLFFSGVWSVVTKHNVAGLFWGTFPMGFVTIVTMICYVCVPAWGKRWAYIALGFWWLDIVVAVTVSLGMTFVMFTRQRQTVQTLAPQWLLPIVSCVVASASGGIVAQTLMPFNANLARGTLVASYCVWGCGLPLAMMVIALLIFRFATGGAPRGQSLAAVFLPVGPCGQGSFGIATMGVVARQLAYEHDVSIIPGLHGDDAKYIASAMYAGGLVVGFVLWGLALAWYTIGMAMFIDGVRRDPKLLGLGNFTVSLWALTFPIGTFATSSIVLGHELHSTAFKVVGAFLATQVILHWLYVSVFTAWKVVQGTLFAAPELSDASPRPRFGWGERVARDIEAGYGEPEASTSDESVPLGPAPARTKTGP
jgi:tellurite resistance protein TehA-like permease